MALPVLEERAEVVYHMLHNRTKTPVEWVFALSDEDCLENEEEERPAWYLEEARECQRRAMALLILNQEFEPLRSSFSFWVQCKDDMSEG